MEIWTNQKGGQRRVKPVLLPLGWFRRWFYEHWQRSKGLKWPLTINFSRVARGRKRLPRNEPERRDNESWNNERRGWLGGKRREKEKRSGGREREREKGRKRWRQDNGGRGKAAFITEHGHDGQSNGHLVPSLLSVRFVLLPWRNPGPN